MVNQPAQELLMTFKDAKREIVDEFERRYLDTLLDRHAGNLSAAERTSGLSRKYLRELIRKHGMFERVLQSRISSLLATLGQQPETP
jgi:DNA-binding NtrC family response regulator